jgi:hypothetical protein
VLAGETQQSGQSIANARVTFTDPDCGHALRVEIEFVEDAAAGAAAIIWCVDTAGQGGSAVTTVADDPD